MTSLTRVAVRALLLPMLLATHACSGDPGGGTGPPSTPTVSISPPTVSMVVGEIRSLTANVNGGSGTIRWTSSTPDIASIDASGTVTGVALGSATMTASLVGETGVSATSSVSVGPNVRAVRVSPDLFQLQYGDTVRLAATVEDLSGAPVSDRPVTWASSAPAVATVSDSGLVTGTGGGAVTITASVQGLGGEASGTVQPFRVADNVTVVDSVALALLSTPGERAAGTYRFEWRGAGSAPEFGVGDVIVGAQGLGFLRRVTAASTSGVEVIVESDPALIGDMVAEGEFGFDVPLFDGSTPSAAPTAFGPAGAIHHGQTWVRAADGVTLRSAQTSGFGINFDGFDVCKFFRNNDPNNACPSVIDEFKFKRASVTFSPSFDFGSTKNGDGVYTEFHGIASGQFATDLSVSLGAKVSAQFSREATILEFGRIIYFQVGVLPVVVHAEMEVKAKFEAKATVKGKIEAGIASSHSVDVGARWDLQQGWQGVLNGNGSFNPSQPSVGDSTAMASITLEAKVTLSPNLNLKFYGVAGPLLGLEEYAKAAMVASTTACNFDSSVGLDGKIGIDLAEFLSKALNNPKLTKTENLAMAPIGMWQCPVGDADVVVQTSGADLDPDGYQLEIAGAPEGAIGTTETRFFGNLREGDREFALKGLADNCSVNGANPATVTIQVGSRATVNFNVECRDTGGGSGGGGGGGGGTTGGIQVSVATSGGLVDPDGYQIDVGGGSRAAGANDQITFSALAPATYTVTISGVSSNCSATPLSQQVTVAIGATSMVSFAVQCRGGQIDITTVTTGDPPRNALLGIDVDGSGSGAIDFNATRSLLLAAGTYDVALVDVPASCVVAGGSTAQVTVADQAIVPVSFLLDCPAGRLTVSVDTQGDNGGVAAYRVVVDGSLTRTVAAQGGRAVFNTLSDGDHVVELLDVPAHCTVAGQNPRTVTVPAAAMLDATCTGSGGAIVYAEGLDLWRMNADGTIPGLMYDQGGTSSEFVKWPSWSPDGSQIVFSKGWYGGLWMIGEQDSIPTPLTQPGYDVFPDWSALGFIAFTRDVNDPDSTVTAIHTIDPTTGGTARITGDDIRFANQPSVSPDGSMIVFSGFPNGGNPRSLDLYRVPVSGGPSVKLTNNPPQVDAWGPSYSPDGQSIAYVEGVYSDPGRGSRKLVSVSIRILGPGGDRVLVAGLDGLSQSVKIAWSPDGTKLMYNSGPQINGVGTTSIYLINADGTGRTLVGSGHDPGWRH